MDEGGGGTVEHYNNVKPKNKNHECIQFECSPILVL